MTYEKSCGAILFRINQGKREYLLVLNKKGNVRGHWGFPKGHTEVNESETDTAKREILEETGIKIDEFLSGFREMVTYFPKPEIIKDVIYFLSEVKDSAILLQESEIADFKWLSYDDALNLVSFNKSLLDKAEEYLNK